MLFLIPFACDSKIGSDSTGFSQVGCNGLIELCDQPIDAVAFTGTHNSMANEEDGWLAPNQGWNVVHQLEAGVRALNLDTYDIDGTVMLCHGFCEIGQRPLVEALNDVRIFIEANPNTVIVITFQDAASAESTLEAFESVGIRDWMHQQDLGSPWPTLRELVDAQTPLLVFASQYGGTDTPGYHSQWEHWIDTPYQAQSTLDFSCDADRGNSETATLLNVNHFITNPIALPEHAESANTEEAILSHIEWCIEERQRTVNQILIDFVDIGDTLAVVESLNLMVTGD